jgi:hypothetical protein
MRWGPSLRSGDLMSPLALRLVPAALLFPVLAACSSSEEAGGQNAGPPVRCGDEEHLGLPGKSATITFPSCSDRKSYSIACSDCSKTPYTCECRIGDTPTGRSITTSSGLCVASGAEDLAEVNAACGWNLQQ